MKKTMTCPDCGNVEAPGAYCSICGPKGKRVRLETTLTKEQPVKLRHARGPLPASPSEVLQAELEPIAAIEAINSKLVTPVEAETLVRVNAEPPQTREAWMLSAIEALTPLFNDAGATVPALRVSVGWPGGRGNKRNTIGQCWAASAVEDGMPAIFISPVLKDPVQVLDVIAHELVHAVGNRGHRGGFSKLAGTLGLVAPWTATTPGPELKASLTALAEKLGPFGHAKVTAEHGLFGIGPSQPPVQSTRMLKVVCPEDGYTVRTTRKWLELGNPSCPDGHDMIEEVK